MALYGISSGVPGLGGPFPTQLGAFLTVSVIVAVALLFGAGRGAADPDHLAPVARYLGAVILLTFFVALFAAFSTAFALSDLLVNHSERSAELRRSLRSESFYTGESRIELPVGDSTYDFSAERDNDANYSAAMASGLVLMTAGGICVAHLRWRRRLDGEAAVVQRIERTARLGVCFVTVLTMAVALAGAGFGIFEIVTPAIAVGGDAGVGRAEGISETISFGLLALFAFLAFRGSWRRCGLRRLGPAPADPSRAPAAADDTPAVAWEAAGDGNHRDEPDGS